jgi:uncharacterized FAD-dependent dehydrogenase
MLIQNLQVYLREIPKGTINLDENLKPFIARHCKLPEKNIEKYKILRKTIDARSKNKIHFIYNIKAETTHREQEEIEPEFQEETTERLRNLQVKSNLPQNPVIIGAGPGGLMAAYLLADYGCNPIIIERGKDVDKRKEDIDALFQKRELNEESNFLYGEGGAGTYSDGKLYTRIKDKRIEYILDIFASCGAPQDILYAKRPHIGSDILPKMIKNIRRQIEQMGGHFIWSGKAESIAIENGKCRGALLADGEKIDSPLIIAAPGLSARDFIQSLIASNVQHCLKDFQIGCRIEHTQAFINSAQYGIDAPPPFLGAAEYNMTSRPSKKSGKLNATTFCMCPGGEIIPAADTKGQLSTNGMSRHARNGHFANAGLIVNQASSSFSSPSEAFSFLAELEKRAYKSGGNSYSCPAQGAFAFVQGEKELPVLESSYKLGVVPERLDLVLPKKTAEALKEALVHFEKTMPGFMFSGTLVGIETRVSSPVRFERNPETLESSVKGLYIAGEGAGYAGGIMSSAVDGLKIAEKILTET